MPPAARRSILGVGMPRGFAAKIAAGVTVAEIIGHDHDDVGLVAAGRRYGLRRCGLCIRLRSAVAAAAVVVPSSRPRRPRLPRLPLPLFSLMIRFPLLV